LQICAVTEPREGALESPAQCTTHKEVAYTRGALMTFIGRQNGSVLGDDAESGQILHVVVHKVWRLLIGPHRFADGCHRAVKFRPHDIHEWRGRNGASALT
jgi:hypothetical protein